MKVTIKTKPHVLILEDEEETGLAILTSLQSAGYSARLFVTGKEFLHHYKHEGAVLYVLDWRVPDISGFEVLQKIRYSQADVTPVIFVTARKSELDIAEALNEGADDYITKPFSQAIFLARVRAVIRRANTTDDEPPVLNIPPFVIDKNRNEISHHGVMCNLTEKEFKLAWLLFSALGSILTRKKIVEAVWGANIAPETRTLDTHIYRLRKKMQLGPENGFRLITVHKLGYRLEQVE